MILKEDGFSLCLVDWGFAGIYPRFFEIAMVPCVVPYDAPFEPLFMQELEKVMNFTDAERQLIKLIRCVRSANTRWTFGEVASFDYEAFTTGPQEGSEPKESVQVYKSTYNCGRES